MSFRRQFAAPGHAAGAGDDRHRNQYGGPSRSALGGRPGGGQRREFPHRRHPGPRHDQGELGIYYLAFSLLMIARGIQSQLVAAPYMFYCHRYEGDDLATYSGSVVAHQIGFSASAAVGMLGCVGAIWLGARADLGPTALVLAGVLPVLLLREFSRNYSLSHVRPGGAMVLDVAHASLQLGLLWTLWRLRLLSVNKAYLVMGTTAAIVCLGWFFMERGRWRVELSWISIHWRHNWQLARWRWPAILSAA